MLHSRHDHAHNVSHDLAYRIGTDRCGSTRRAVSGISKAMALNLASATAGNWCRQEYHDSGKPWQKTTSGPSPTDTVCTAMPLTSTRSWVNRWVTNAIPICRYLDHLR
jgi:hypothetical protein